MRSIFKIKHAKKCLKYALRKSNLRKEALQEAFRNKKKTVKGCISTEPHQMNIIKNRRNSKNNIHKNK